MSEPLLPLFVNLSGAKVVVTGAGLDAAEAADRLAAAGARVTRVGPGVAEAPGAAAERVDAEPAAEHLDGALLLVAASDEPAADAAVLAAAAERGLLASSQTGGEAPAVLGCVAAQGRVAVAATSSGLCLELDERLAREAGKLLVPSIEAFAEVLGNVRGKLAERYPDRERRDPIWEQIFESPVLPLLQAGDEDEAIELAERMAWGTG